MPKLSAPQFHVVTNAELDARLFPFKSDDVIFNEETSEIRLGPGAWADCTPLVRASTDITLIDGQAWEVKRMVRTSDGSGLISLDLTDLFPGITAARMLSAVTTEMSLQAVIAGLTPLSACTIQVLNHTTLQPSANKEMIITLAIQR